jgi:phytoene/squalene synthetase
MRNTSATLARSITWTSSKQSFLTARLLADRDLVDDCLRAYAYFRWADDTIDKSLATGEERIAFIRRQKSLAENMYRRECPADLSPEEAMLADLIRHDRGPDSGLRSFIRNFLAVLEFDAGRRERLVSRQDLEAYSAHLATAVMDGIQYFIGNGHPYPRTPARTLAVLGAHTTHMLRDMLDDLSAGFVNIPAETLQEHGFRPGEVKSEPFRAWVRAQVRQARYAFREGKTYIDSLEHLRCKLAGTWYCTRFERLLDTIEDDDYVLRPVYDRGRTMAAWAGMARLGFRVTWAHFAGRLRRVLPRLRPRFGLDPDVELPSCPFK